MGDGEREDSGSTAESEDMSGGGTGSEGEAEGEGQVAPREHEAASASHGPSSHARHRGRAGAVEEVEVSSESAVESAAGTSPASQPSISSHQPGSTGETGLGRRTRQNPARAHVPGRGSREGVGRSPSVETAGSAGSPSMLSAKSDFDTASSGSPMRTASSLNSEPSPEVTSMRARTGRARGQRRNVVIASSEDDEEEYESGEE